MPIKKVKFTLTFDDLQSVIDVDDSVGRSVPTNMNFVDEGYLTKDTGFVVTGQPISAKAHSLFYYKKKNGTNFLIRGYLTKLQYYSFVNRAWYDITGSPTFTAEKEFGFYVYNDELWGCNGVEDYFKWDGTTFTGYSSAPKGNNLEVFEDRMFVSGVTAEPLTLYYSDVGAPQTFQVASVIKPLGTDAVVGQKNYYGVLLIFKRESIWKLSFQYDSVIGNYIPKLELQSASYGACSRKAFVTVENDIWFFTGKEVRAIGYQDNLVGVFGVNQAVISEGIKETLALIDPDNYSVVSTYYANRRYYLTVPLTSTTNDTMFVCHLLYKKSWTKYSGRDKAHANDFAVVDDIIYSTYGGTTYGVIKWTVEAADALSLQNYLITEQTL